MRMMTSFTVLLSGLHFEGWIFFLEKELQAPNIIFNERAK